MTAHECRCVAKAVKADRARILRAAQDHVGTGTTVTFDQLRRIVLGDDNAQ